MDGLSDVAENGNRDTTCVMAVRLVFADVRAGSGASLALSLPARNHTSEKYYTGMLQGPYGLQRIPDYLRIPIFNPECTRNHWSVGLC